MASPDAARPDESFSESINRTSRLSRADTFSARPVWVKACAESHVSSKVTSKKVLPAGETASSNAPPVKRLATTEKARKMMTLSVVDDFSLRLRRSRSMRLLAAGKQWTALWLAGVGCLSILVCCLIVELRLGSLEAPRADLDVLRSLNVALTLVLLALLLKYHYQHRQLMQSCMTESSWLHLAQVVFECGMMLLGVWPPGVELQLPLWLVDPAKVEDAADLEWHIDQLSVLMFVRVPYILN